MSIAPIDVVNASGSEVSTPKTKTLGKDDFLRLLITQLKSQDPLKPMESTEFTAQLSQFSSLEELYTINDNLQYLQLYQASLNNSQAVNFIGKTVEASGNSFKLMDGVSNDMRFDLTEDTRAVYIYIYDSSEHLVKRIEYGGLKAGVQSIEWDGTDSQGNISADGEYTFDVMAVNANDETVNATTFTREKVTGVTYRDGTTVLLAGDQEIPIGDVTRITASEN